MTDNRKELAIAKRIADMLSDNRIDIRRIAFFLSVDEDVNLMPLFELYRDFKATNPFSPGNKPMQL